MQLWFNLVLRKESNLRLLSFELLRFESDSSLRLLNFEITPILLLVLNVKQYFVCLSIKFQGL